MLETNGENYLERAIDARTHLTAEELDDAIGDPDRENQLAAEGLPASVRSKALQALCRHLNYSLRKEYLQILDPAKLWLLLRARFMHDKIIFLP